MKEWQNIDSTVRYICVSCFWPGCFLMYLSLHYVMLWPLVDSAWLSLPAWLRGCTVIKNQELRLIINDELQVVIVRACLGLLKAKHSQWNWKWCYGILFVIHFFAGVAPAQGLWGVQPEGHRATPLMYVWVTAFMDTWWRGGGGVILSEGG